MAVLFQSAMTSARTGVLAEIRARPTIATFNTFIVASEKLDFRTTANVVWMYLRKHVVVHATAPRYANASADYQGSIAIFAKPDFGGAWRRRTLLLRRIRFRS
jgi:hypothetical protein